MTGLRLNVTTNFSDPTNELPVLRDDYLLTRGSLVLIDFAHSADPLVGVPAEGALIPNIAWKEAAELHGSGSKTDWAMMFSRVLAQSPGGDGFVERSTKGGVHVVMSQATQTGIGKGAYIGRTAGGFDTKLRVYLFNHLDHVFYFSSWERKTRLALASSPEASEALIWSNSGSATVNNLILEDRTVNRSGSAQQGSRSVPALPVSATGNTFRNVAGKWALPSGNPSGANQIGVSLMAIGQMPSPYAGFGANKSRSAVLYRSYLEDLTVSGRTFGEVDAIDKALFDQAFGPGGRYFGDTFTDPATYP
ncbi:hypothetical protein [Brevundimonas nasdae]|uniref:Uncharacterized protein n=1 Tax=Brevundimonas nasdae TaxID=172043 RepID=A0ABX8TIR5_9CAUL|nr:hypothetical protein [Brevundimonas nasdae]QYC10554.1 hypothetical protein KWG56_00580 [Brevundimonas nasdae]QYC13341.1 hypothetical protein KWG63_14135 [Brevundimonas nasdae]